MRRSNGEVLHPRRPKLHRVGGEEIYTIKESCFEMGIMTRQQRSVCRIITNLRRGGRTGGREGFNNSISLDLQWTGGEERSVVGGCLFDSS
jgi:hypothetical protein